jgi:hypothetical protein
MITLREVYVYREIYYETVKPMLKARRSQADIQQAVDYQCQEFGLTVARYEVLSALDLRQRLSTMNDPRVHINTGPKVLSLEEYRVPATMPTLRCPRRTEQKD